MQACVVSFKECWQDGEGNWLSYGGFPLQMSALASLFDQLTLLVVRGTNRLGGIALPANVEVITLVRPAGEDLRRKVSVMLHLPYYLREIARLVLRSEAVYIPLPGDVPFLGMLVTLALRRPMLARYCGSWFPTSQTTLMNRITRSCMRAFAGGRNLMLATGAGSQPPAPDMHWIYATAISQDEIGSIQPLLDRPVSRPLRLVYAGRLSPEKGVEFLIDALRILHERKNASSLPHLSVAGDGPQRTYLETLVKKYNCHDAVSFAGQLDRQDLLEHLANADVCLLPSLTESFCKARLDAMLCGVPVVTTEVGFGRELVGKDGERGWVVPVGDAGSIADVIGRLSSEAIDWPALRKRCRAYVTPMSLEAWTADIGAMCAKQWGLRLEEGKLR